MPSKTPGKTLAKRPRPSGVAVTLTKGGGFRLRAFGPNAPDLRTVVPELLGTRPSAPPDDEECRTCLGNGRIRDGETGELRRCLDCSGTGGSS
jgi:hypothetical protein